MTPAMRTGPGPSSGTPAPARLLRAVGRPLSSLPLAAAVRGAVALATPLLIGVLTGWVVPSVIAAIGALWAVGQDGSDPYRSRVGRFVALGLSASLGLVGGELALRNGPSAVVTACLVVAALVAGAIGLRGRIWSVAGMHLLLGVTIGSGIPVPGPWWQAPLALFAGVGFVLVLSAAPWLLRRHQIERAALLAVFRAASTALAAAGTPGAAETRRHLTDALDNAHQAMDRHLTAARRQPPDARVEPLLRAFRLAVRLGEAVTTLQWEARPLPAVVSRVPLVMSARLLPVRNDGAVPVAPDFAPDSPGLRALARLSVTADAERVDTALDAPASPRPARQAHLRYALLLALCVLAAQVCAGLLHSPRAYWLPMTVAFVYKPDFGPVFRRALHRCVGTVVGVAAIGAVSMAIHSTYAFIGVVAFFGALMAVGVRHHYALATTGLTAVVFVLVDLLGDHRALYGARILDTTLAAALVLVVHFVAWPRSALSRADSRTQAALAAAHRYRDLSPTVGPDRRQALRRDAYRQLADARRAAVQARREPVLRGTELPDWERAITSAEELCDAVTARALHAAPGPAPQTTVSVASSHAM
ncbi:putative membrane protein YccC [Streptomyces sp. 3212.3]|uniref:FUSC family protein n=1 Tax=Streptomyces sp. 3212.3 TaxID=1938846 RepID=UPI000E37EE7B|nr:FUSC family protein [Streptomyces sp. 3212.3]REE57822.1 putative membrane protein YccC [Streptomyces sp. 3212.3]